MTDRSNRAPGGWGVPPPPGVPPCLCPDRRYYWARLERRRFEGCCRRACCGARVSAVMVTEAELLALQAQAVAEHWRCPRCGELVLRHQAMFSCVDRTTKLLREKKRWEQQGRARR